MSERGLRKLDFLLQFRGNSKNALKAVQEFNQKFRAEFEKAGLDVNLVLKKQEASVRRSMSRLGKSAANSYQKAFSAAFVGGGVGALGKESDDFVYNENQMRGATTGLRHEVGKLRNTFLLIAFATAGIVSSFKEWFKATLDNEAALVGLKSVAINTGISFERLRDYSMALEKEGLLSMGGAAAAQKNLAASNLSLGQILDVMDALKNAAAFNRQGTLSMEEAIVGATQGIKNQNSIMIDNAGITKNVSIMYREYASTIGKTAGKLTEAEKRQAIVNGILHEAALFAGNAEKSLDTYQGKLAKFNTSMLLIKKKMGSLIVEDIMGGFSSIEDVFIKLGDDSKVISGVKAISSYFKSAIEAMLVFLKRLDENFINIFNLLDNTISKMTIFFVLLYKVGAYLNNISSKMAAGAAQASLEGNRKALMYKSVLMDPEYGKLQPSQGGILLQTSKDEAVNKRINSFVERRVTLAQQRVAVQSRINELLKSGKATDVMRLNIGKQLNATKAGELEYQLLVNQAIRAGYDVRKYAEGAKVGKNDVSNQYRLALPGTPVGKNETVVAKALIGAEGQKTLNIFDKMVVKMYNFKVATVAAVKQSVILFKTIRTQGLFSVTVFNSVKLAVIGLGTALKSIFTGILAIASKLLIWYTIISTAIDLFKMFWSQLFEVDKLQAEHLKKIQNEQVALDGLKKKQIELNGTLEARQRYTTKESNYADLLTKTGRSLANTTKELNDYNEEIQKTLDFLNTHELNAEDFDEKMAYIDELKTRYNSLYQELILRSDEFNQSLESAIELSSKLASGMKGQFSTFLNKFDTFRETLQTIVKARLDLLATPIDKDIAKSLGIKELTAYHALMKAAELQYTADRESIIAESEKKITEIRKQAHQERLKLLRSSNLKELDTLLTNYDDQIQKMKAQIQELQVSKLLGSQQMSLLKLQIDLETTKAQSKASQLIIEIGKLGEEVSKKINLSLESLDKLTYFEKMEKLNKLPKYSDELVKALEEPLFSQNKSLENLKTNYLEILNLIPEISSKLSDPTKLSQTEITDLEQKLLLFNKTMSDFAPSTLNFSDGVKGLKEDFIKSFTEVSRYLDTFRVRFSDLLSNITQGNITEMSYDLAKKTAAAVDASTNATISALQKSINEYQALKESSTEFMINRYADVSSELKSLSIQGEVLNKGFFTMTPSINKLNSEFLELKESTELAKFQLAQALEEIEKFPGIDVRKIRTLYEALQGAADQRFDINRTKTLYKNYSSLIDDYIAKTAEIEDLQAEVFARPSIIESVFGLDAGGLAKMDVQFQRLRENTTDHYHRLMYEAFDLGNQKALKNLQDQLQLALEQIDIQEQLEKIQKYKEAWASTFKSIIEGGYNVGLAIADVFKKTTEYQNEKADMIKEQNDLYMQGEISTGEHLRRLGEINKYYANQIDNVWKNMALDIAKSFVDMTAQAIQQMGVMAATQEAMKSGTDFLGGILGGLGTAIPYFGAAIGVGLLSGLLSNAQTDISPPEFDTSESRTTSKFGGTIKAEEVNLTISPTIIIDGNQIFIGSGSIIEFVEESQQLMKEVIQQAIDNKEIDISSLRSQG